MKITIPESACRKFAEENHPIAYGATPSVEVLMLAMDCFARSCRELVDVGTTQASDEGQTAASFIVRSGSGELTTLDLVRFVDRVEIRSGLSAPPQYSYRVYEKAACVKVFAQVYRRLRAAYGQTPLF